jgi:hypothetical protein
MGKMLGFLVIGLVACVPTLWAAEKAYEHVWCFSGKVMALESTADITALSVDSLGIVTHSTAKEFENASGHCVGYVRIMAGKSVGKGLCKFLGSEGDSSVLEWDLTGTESPWSFLSGTGKFKGIQGGGLWKNVASGKPIAEGTVQNCDKAWGKYKLP